MSKGIQRVEAAHNSVLKERFTNYCRARIIENDAFTNGGWPTQAAFACVGSKRKYSLLRREDEVVSPNAFWTQALP
jgi:hypothetical protein